MTALLSVLPLPGFNFEPVASASTRSVTSLMQPGSDQPADDAKTESVVVGEESIDEFTLIGLTFDREPTGPVSVRVSRDGVWDDWRELAVETDESPDQSSAEGEGSQGAPNFGTEPYFVGSADGYQVRLDASEAEDADVVLVRESLARTVADTTPLADAATTPPINLRASWGARAPVESPSYASSVNLAVVHHSDSSNSYSPAQVPSAIRSIQAFHMDGRKWNDIAYNFVVDKYGGIWEGRGGGIDRAVVGAHAQGFNTGTVGVLVLGTYTTLNPSAAAVESVSHVIGWKMAQYGNNPAGSVTVTSGGSPKYPAGKVVTLPRVVGHGDVGSTACPGFVRNYLGTIRTRSADFYRFYYALLKPVGAIESVSGGVGTVSLAGWAVDRAATNSAWIRASVGSDAKSLYTTLPRPDIAAKHGGNGNAGFFGSFADVPPGMQSVCATVKGTLGTDTRLGCQWVLVTDPDDSAPVGRFDSIEVTPGRIFASGWALDPNSKSSLRYELLVDGVVRWSDVADGLSSTVPQERRAYHGLHRKFTAQAVAVPAGDHTVCVRGKNVGRGQDALVDCRTVNVPPHVPGGVVETIGSSRANRFDVTGWALDLESTSPVNILIRVGNRTYTVPADRRRDDIAARYPGYGASHGFAATVYADGGNQSYCVYAKNIAGGSDGKLACGTINIVK